MPIYCYECQECGAVKEEFHFRVPGGPSARPPESMACRTCGGTARRSYAAESPRGRRADCGEIRSLAAGVMPEQAASAQRQFEARGVEGVRFDRATGDAIFRDRGARLKALKVMGLHDKNEIRG